MKKTTFWFLPLILLLAVTIFSGCSNDANSAIDDDNSPADARGSLISFRLGATGYNADEAGATRAAGTGSEGRVLSSSSEDLGDGLEALVQVVEAPEAKAQTRAVVSTAPAGTYTILAYQNGVQKAKWVLNYASNGSYTMAEGKEEQYLPAGSYKFYVFNQYLTFSNGKIVKSLDKANQDALFSEIDVTIPNRKKHTVNFILSPAFAKVYFKVRGFSGTAFSGKMNGKLLYDANQIPGTETFDIATRTSSSANVTAGGAVNVGDFSDNVPAAGFLFSAQNFTKTLYKESYVITKQGSCFLAGTDVTKLRYQFDGNVNGTIYGKAVKGKTLNITNPISGNLQTGKSYTVYVTVYYKANYLFSDGTTGSLLANKNKTVVGLVIGGNSNTGNLAIGISNAGYYAWSTYGNKGRGGVAKNNYVQNENGLKQAVAKYDGWNETWESTYAVSPKREIRALNAAGYPAFYRAAHYKGKVNGKDWYLPAAGDWELALKYFGITDPAKGYSKGREVKYTANFQLADILFYQANGDSFNDWYWTSNAWSTANAAAISVLIYDSWHGDKIHFGGAEKDNTANVRAFIRY